MTTATVVTTEIRDELVERINSAHARLQTQIDTSVLALNDHNEYFRLNAKRLALMTATETIMGGIDSDDVEQFNAVQVGLFDAHRAFTEIDFDAETAGYRSGYALVIDYMRYSIGRLEN